MLLLSTQNFPFAQEGFSLCNSLRMPLAVLSPTVWGSLPFLCPLLWPFRLCWPPASWPFINTCVWESLWLNHKIVCKLLGSVAWVWLVWGAAASFCATALLNSLLSVTACEMESLLPFPFERRQWLDGACQTWLFQLFLRYERGWGNACLESSRLSHWSSLPSQF